MEERDRIVCRFKEGRALKGFLRSFDPLKNDVIVTDVADGKDNCLRLDDLKAIFFVRTFDGDRGYQEKKIYGACPAKGHRVFIRFRDGESLVGFLEGEVPWKRGFFLSRREMDLQGFFLLPVDEDANNIKVFVVAASVDDLTIVP